MPNTTTPATSKNHSPAWLALGFRPFYLLAASWAVIALLMWLMIYHSQSFSQSASHLIGVHWHAHEMVFGFAATVIVGFLFTAVKNWTGLATPTGYTLLGLVCLWLATRVLLLSSWSALGALLEVIFFACAAIGIGIPLVRSANRRNLFFIVLISLLGVLAGLHHYSLLFTSASLNPSQIIQLALGLISIIVTVIAGRVIPMFTRNSCPGVSIKQSRWLEIAAIASVLLVSVSITYTLNSWLSCSVLLFAAGIHLKRWWGWSPWSARRLPILLILHLSYLWLPLSFLLRALSSWMPLASNAATHALTVGVIGGLCLGMMGRTARGHTGRLLQAGLLEIIGYALIAAAAVIRTLFPLLVPALYSLWISLSGFCFISAFILYLVQFTPWLLSPRADGRSG